VQLSASSGGRCTEDRHYGPRTRTWRRRHDLAILDAKVLCIATLAKFLSASIAGELL
jgi:hypothetical protein